MAKIKLQPFAGTINKSRRRNRLNCFFQVFFADFKQRRREKNTKFISTKQGHFLKCLFWENSKSAGGESKNFFWEKSVI